MMIFAFGDQIRRQVQQSKFQMCSAGLRVMLDVQLPFALFPDLLRLNGPFSEALTSR